MAQTNSIMMFKKRLLAEVARDKKKACILGLLLVAAIFFVGKVLFKSSPETAVAMQATPAATDQSPAGSSGAGNPTLIKLNNRTPAVKISRKPVKAVTRDIFQPNPTIFPIVEAVELDNQPSVVKGSQDDRTKVIKAKNDKIRQQGALLKLEGVTIRPDPIAIINGAVLGRGGVINGFRVVRIEFQRCVVEKDGVELNLTMKQ